MTYLYAMQTEFEEILHQTLGVPISHTHEIAACFKPKSLAKNEIFQIGNQFLSQIGFVQSGFIREYFVDEEGKEVTKWIATPGNVFMDIYSVIFNQPGRWRYQALTDCQLRVISKRDYEQLRLQIPFWGEIEKLLLAKCFVVLENRIVSHLSMTSEERYKVFFAQNPELFNQVPLQFLASMLGMTPETFSRIRKKHSQRIS